MKEKDRISPYRQTEHGKAREIDFVDGKMVYLDNELVAARLRQQEIVRSFQGKKENPFNEFFKLWCAINNK